MATPKTTVAWCRGCRYWIDPEHIGETCIGYPECGRTLIKRVGYICPAEFCMAVHWRVRDMKACDHLGTA